MKNGVQRAVAASLLISLIWSLIRISTDDLAPDLVEVAIQVTLGGALAYLLIRVISPIRSRILYSAATVGALLISIFIIQHLIASIFYFIFFFDSDYFYYTTSEILLPYYWEFQYDRRYSILYSSADLFAIAVLVAIMVWTGKGGAASAMALKSRSVPPSGFAGMRRHHDSSELNRVVLANAFTGGSGFRQSVIERADEPFNAPALEVGIDMPRLVHICRAREHEETRYVLALILPAIGAVAGVAQFAATQNPALLVGAFALTAVINGIRRARIHARALREFGTGHMADAKKENEADSGQVDEETTNRPPDAQNIVVYSGFSPFEFAGLPMGGWTVTIDTARPPANTRGDGKTGEFEEADLWNLMIEKVEESGVEGLSARSLVVVHGTDARALPSVPTVKGIKKPRVELRSEERDFLLSSAPNTFRRYLWISALDWSGDLSVSVFWRCSLRNRMLQVELSRFVLLPIESSKRWIDGASDNWQFFASQVMIGALSSPFVLVATPWRLFHRFQAALARTFGSANQARVNEIKLNPKYNFGAPESLRRQLMGSSFQHYFQKMDMQFYQNTADKVLLESLVDFLDEHGIDTTELKDNQSAIFNSGVIVQGGDVTAQNLAVGENAKALSGLMNRTLRAGAASGAEGQSK